MAYSHAFAPSAFQNDAFQVSLSPYVYPNDLGYFSMTINGVEVAGYLDLERDQPEVVSVVEKYPTVTFNLYDVPSSVSIEQWHEVIVYDNVNKTFAGVAVNIKSKEAEVTYGFDYEISCVGYAKLLETKLIAADKYDAATDAYVIGDLFAKYLPEIDAVTYVSALKTFEEIPFGRKTLKEVLDYICKITGGHWSVDYEKRLHYFGSEVETAGFGFSNTPDLDTTYPYYDFEKIVNGNNAFNVVEVVGGSYLSEDETIYLAGNGASNRISLPFKYHAPEGQTSIQVWRNDGTEASPVWTPMIVKAGYLNTAGWPTDALYFFEEKVLEQIAAWPALTNAVKLTGRYEAKLRVRVDDQDAITAIGREIEYAYFDDQILDKDIARALGRGLLSANSGGIITYRWKCEKRGLQAGIKVPFVHSGFSINESLAIQKTTTTIGIGGAIVVEVEAGAYHPNLVDAMLALKKAAAKSVSYYEEGALDVLLTYTETCTPTETTSVTAS